MSITLEVRGGLGSRLRSMISAMCLAEDLGKSLQVIWSPNHPECMARFETLFDITKLPSWVTVSTNGLSTLLLIPSPPHITAQWLKHLRALQPFVTPVVEPNTIGVHLRRDLEPMIELMKTYTDAHFIVATDLSSVRTAMKNKFGPRVTFHATSLTRMTQQGMLGALADFVALSKCTEIIENSKSSFSEMAALYGNVVVKMRL
jgi:hypothetical protein